MKLREEAEEKSGLGAWFCSLSQRYWDLTSGIMGSWEYEAISEKYSKPWWLFK